MAREMYLVGVDESELQPSPKPEPPKGFKGKWANYWYHYKWVTLISLFALVVLIVILVQMFSREKEDYRLALVTEKIVSTTVLEELETELASYGRDLNGDGKVVVSIENLYIGGQDQMSPMANQQKFILYLSAGDPMFFAFDDYSFKNRVVEYLESDPEEDIVFFDELPFASEDIHPEENYWDWVNAPFIQDEDRQKQIPKHLYFGVRQAVGMAGGKDAVQIHDDCLELLEAFATGKPLSEETE